MADAGPDWNRLRALIAGAVLLPGTPGYAAACAPPVARSDEARPRAVVLTGADIDVVAKIRFARRHGLRVSPRSGGHCFAGRSRSGEVIIDVSPMREVSVTSDRVDVGAGVRLGDLDDALAAAGRVVPTDCGRSVGIAGLALGGGLGILGRTLGLSCDRMVRARVVLADGRIGGCDDDHHGDLFWALRGACGGQFGVVTSLAFATDPAPTVTCVHLMWPATHAGTAIEAWQRWAPTSPDEVDRRTVRDCPCAPGATAGRAARRDPRERRERAARPTTSRRGAHRRGRQGGAQPATATQQTTPYRDAKLHLAARAVADTHDPQGVAPEAWPEFSKSEFSRHLLPRHAIVAALDSLGSERVPGQSRRLSLTPGGGAYNRTSADATAFAHRKELFLLEQVETVHPTASPPEQATARHWLTRSWAEMHPWGSGRAYPKIPDPDLDDWATLADPDPRPRSRTHRRPMTRPDREDQR